MRRLFFIVLPPDETDCTDKSQGEKREINNAPIEATGTLVVETGGGFGAYATALATGSTSNGQKQ